MAMSPEERRARQHASLAWMDQILGLGERPKELPTSS